MITADEAIFPNNVVEIVASALSGIDPDVMVKKRPLRNSDPAQSVGIHAQLWDPDEESLEMLGAENVHPQRPTLQRYVYGLQAFVKDGDEERGLAVHSTLAHRVRAVLYSHPTLRLVLGGLEVTYADNSKEVLKRWGITRARYFSGEIDASFLYLSTLEFWVETETH